MANKFCSPSFSSEQLHCLEGTGRIFFSDISQPPDKLQGYTPKVTAKSFGRLGWGNDLGMVGATNSQKMSRVHWKWQNLTKSIKNQSLRAKAKYGFCTQKARISVRQNTSFYHLNTSFVRGTLSVRVRYVFCTYFVRALYVFPLWLFQLLKSLNFITKRILAILGEWHPSISCDV